jgi:uncharacterized FlaG/YvyC family protein
LSAYNSLANINRKKTKKRTREQDTSEKRTEPLSKATKVEKSTKLPSKATKAKKPQLGINTNIHFRYDSHSTTVCVRFILANRVRVNGEQSLDNLVFQLSFNKVQQTLKHYA